MSNLSIIGRLPVIINIKQHIQSDRDVFELYAVELLSLLGLSILAEVLDQLDLGFRDYKAIDWLICKYVGTVACELKQALIDRLAEMPMIRCILLVKHNPDQNYA